MAHVFRPNVINGKLCTKTETLEKFSCKVFIFESYKVKTLHNRDAKFSVTPWVTENFA